jgi:hypothetical protein
MISHPMKLICPLSVYSSGRITGLGYEPRSKREKSCTSPVYHFFSNEGMLRSLIARAVARSGIK